MKMAQLVLHKLFQRSYKMKRQVASFKISGLGSVRRQKWQNKAPGDVFLLFYDTRAYKVILRHVQTTCLFSTA